MSRRWPVIALAVLMFAAGCSGHSSSTVFDYHGANKLGTTIAIAQRKPSGPVTGSLVSGGDYQLNTDIGHVVVLNFFASWCGPCAIESPQFDNIYRERKASGVRFVGLGVKDSRARITSWVAAKRLSFPVVSDEPAKTAIELGNIPTTGLPDTVLVDKHGRIAAVYNKPLTAADLNPVLDQLQSET